MKKNESKHTVPQLLLLPRWKTLFYPSSTAERRSKEGNKEPLRRLCITTTEAPRLNYHDQKDKILLREVNLKNRFTA
jgi:hypothetical protein